MTVPMPPDTRAELATLLRSRIPLVLIETRDEPRVLALIAGLAVKLQGAAHTPVFQWTVTDGLLLENICQGYAQIQRTLVLISHELGLPRELEHFAARFQLALPIARNGRPSSRRSLATEDKVITEHHWPRRSR